MDSDNELFLTQSKTHDDSDTSEVDQADLLNQIVKGSVEVQQNKAKKMLRTE